MIVLSVYPFCHNCNMFWPEVIRCSTEQQVTCEHRFKCEEILNYLKKELMRSTEK